MNPRNSKGRDFNSILVLDSWNPHRDINFRKAMLDFYGVQIVIIPGVMTPLLQPADIPWNRLVKHKIIRYWREWMEKQLQSSEDGKVKRPSCVQIAEGGLRGWEELDKNLIINSFKNANIGKSWTKI